MGLNSEQQRAVLCEDNLLVIAPPGSGKTGTLVAKVKHIIKANLSNKVIMVTFTDASATEAKHRVSQSLTPNEMKRVAISTFHSHALYQLRQTYKNLKILTAFESKEVLKKALLDCDSKIDLKDAEVVLQTAKSNPQFTGKECDYIAAYELRRKQYHAFDFQDFTREALNGMKSKDANAYIEPLEASHVLCDEFQDVDANQLHWLLHFHSLGAKVTVVGDDDQSVYGFRNSLGYAAMEEFKNETAPVVINLQTNYRSHSEIIHSATSLIQKNATRMDKVIVCNKGEGGHVSFYKASSKEDEADKIIEEIVNDCADNNFDVKSIPSGRWGLIARNNRDLWLIAAMLSKEEIPFSKSNKKDDAPWEILTFCGLLVSIQTNDILGLKQALSAYGIKDKILRHAHEILKDNFYTIMDGEFPEIESLELEDRNKIKEFVRVCSRWRELTAEGQYSRVIGAVGEWFLSEVVRGADVKDDFLRFVQLLSGEKNKKNKSKNKVSGNLQVRVMNFFRKETKSKSNGVNLHTMHDSKGLEFDRVFVAQCNVGTIPSSKCTDVNEERRLFYVAMTRARKDLIMSSVSSKGDSSFLSEIVIN